MQKMEPSEETSTEPVENPELTEDQKKLYLDSEGTICPVCGSEDLQFVSDIQLDALFAYVEEQCWKCKTIWRLEFSMELNGICSKNKWTHKKDVKV